MKLSDLVYPFYRDGDTITIGMIVETYNNRTSVYNIFVNGRVYIIPKHKLVLAW